MATPQQVKPRSKEFIFFNFNFRYIKNFLRYYTVFIFIVGAVATSALAASLIFPNFRIDNYLQSILIFSEYIWAFFILAIYEPLEFVYRKFRRLTSSLMATMIVQVSIIIIIMFIALRILIVDTTDQYFNEPTQASLEISNSLKNDIFNQSYNNLENVANIAIEEISPIAGNLFSAGIVLDQLRIQHSLSKIALINAKGEDLIISPPNSEPIKLVQFDLQQIEIGFPIRKIIDNNEFIQHLLIQPMFNQLGEDPPVGLWVEESLPVITSSNIRDIDTVNRNYRNAQSLRTGYVKSYNTIVRNIFWLVLLAAVYSSLLIGRRLNRLDNLSLKMKEVSEMPIPTGNFEVDENVEKDEIAEVSTSFNNLLKKQGESIAKEKQTRENLQLILDSIDAGLIVLNEDNRIIENNKAATRLLGLDIKNTRLHKLKVTRQELTQFCDLVGDNQEEVSQEVIVGRKKLWVHITPTEEDYSSRIIMFTDLSKPLASEQIKSTHQALQFTLHSLKNPLQPLLYHAHSLDKFVPELAKVDQEKLNKKRDTLLHHINRIDQMIKLMRDSIPNENFKTHPVDLNKIIQQVVKHFAPNNTNYQLELDDSHPFVFYRESELQDMLENLNTNAEQQYELQEISSRVTKISTREIDDIVEMTFEDTAGGVHEDKISKIFNLHMSFKAGGQGLGLARIKMFLEYAGGSIAVENVSNKISTGAKFIITFKGVKMGLPIK